MTVNANRLHDLAELHSARSELRAIADDASGDGFRIYKTNSDSDIHANLPLEVAREVLYAAIGIIDARLSGAGVRVQEGP